MSKHYHYLQWITVLYVTFQLVSDVTAGKIISVLGFPVSVTVLYFPITYIFADVLTEVYGYARARATLWIVLACSILAGTIYQVVVLLPPAAGFESNEAYVTVLGQVPRVLLGGWLAVFAGEILNNFLMAKLKVRFGGKMLWVRTVTSTVFGQFANTLIFYSVALYGALPTSLLIQSMLTGWLLKVGIEVLMTPLTYFVIGYLKRVEGEDYFDRNTDFNPFKFHT